MATLYYEAILSDPRTPPPDEFNSTTDGWFHAPTTIMRDGVDQDLRPYLTPNVTPGDLTAPGDAGRAWMDYATWQDEIWAAYEDEPSYIVLTTQQADPVGAADYTPSMVTVRAFLDVEVRAIGWPAGEATVVGNVQAPSDARTAVGIVDAYPITDTMTVYSLPIRGWNFDFDPDAGDPAGNVYRPLVTALAASEVESNLHVGGGNHGQVEIGWVRLRVEVDLAGLPPIRRTFPRPDGRVGGAPRTFPPSPTIQSGNRTSGAIF